ncbi:polyprenol monophosphomannose synthase [Thermodesulfobacteriota bacterium]
MAKSVTDNPFDSPKLSIVVPTLREAMNIPILVREISANLEHAIPEWELIVVDDNSEDGIVGVCDRLRKQGISLKLIVRTNERGLATAVLEGFKHARAPVFVVMDADLSHPPAVIPVLYREVRQGVDFVLGSRYIEGGGTDDRWTLYRYLNSKFASLLARGLVSASDPMSGFFGLPRSLWEQCDELSPSGYKIALELIVKGKPKNLKEVPIHFRTRQIGESKLTFKQQLLYLSHLRSLYIYRWSAGK